MYLVMWTVEHKCGGERRIARDVEGIDSLIL